MCGMSMVERFVSDVGVDHSDVGAAAGASNGEESDDDGEGEGEGGKAKASLPQALPAELAFERYKSTAVAKALPRPVQPRPALRFTVVSTEFPSSSVSAFSSMWTSSATGHL